MFVSRIGPSAVRRARGIAREARAAVVAGAKVAATPFYEWTKEDFDELRSQCQILGCDPRDMLATIALETGNTFNPAAAFRNAAGYPDAIGLNQITHTSANAMGIDEAERLSLLDLTPEEQLPYVTRSFLADRNFKPFPTPPDAVTLYQTNIAPSTVPNETVFTQKEFPCPSPQVAKTNYCANIGLDANKDGVITRSDLAVKLQGFMDGAPYKLMVEKLDGLSPVPNRAPAAGVGGRAPLPLVAGIVAIGAYAFYRTNK